jgi:hypothetical protein
MFKHSAVEQEARDDGWKIFSGTEQGLAKGLCGGRQTLVSRILRFTGSFFESLRLACFRFRGRRDWVFHDAEGVFPQSVDVGVQAVPVSFGLHLPSPFLSIAATDE